MIVCSLEVKKDLFHIKEDKEEQEELLGSEIPCYSVISALMYILQIIYD